MVKQNSAKEVDEMMGDEVVSAALLADKGYDGIRVADDAQHIVNARTGRGTQHEARLTEEERELLDDPAFVLVELDDELDAADDPNDFTRWLVQGWIKLEGYTFLYGREGSGKSLAGIDLAIATTHGRLWLNRFEVAQVNTLYIDEDSNTKKTWRQRVKAMGAKRGLGVSQEAGGKKLYSMLLQGVELDNYRKRREIIAYCKKYKIELVIMDSFQRLHRMNHRDSVAMRTLNAMIKEFFAAGIALVMLHHATKGRKGAVEFTGSAEIMTIADNSYFMEKLGKPGSVDFSISPKKMRDIVDGFAPFEIAVMPATVGGVKRLDSLPLEEYKHKYGDQGSVNDVGQAKAKPQYSAVVDVMRKLEAPVSQTKLVELMQYHPRRTGEVKAALQTLMQAYIVEEVEGTRRGLMAYILNHEAADAEYDTLDTLDARLAAGMYDAQDDEDIISEDALDEDDLDEDDE